VLSLIFNTRSVYVLSFQPQAERKETEGRDKHNNSQMPSSRTVRYSLISTGNIFVKSVKDNKNRKSHHIY
jgi:hypothetical protein